MDTDARIAQLEAENARLKAQVEGHPPGHRRAWIRSTAVVVLMTLGFLLVPTAGLAVWTRNTLLNTDQYVETVAPLAQSPAIVDDVANAVTNAIFEQIDVETLLQQNLPPELAFAAGPIAGQVKSTTKDLVVKALDSDQFDVLWKAVNRQASASVVALLTETDTSTVLQVKNGKLVLDLGPIVDDVKAQLAAKGLDFVNKLPAISTSVDLPVANVQYLVDARQGVKLLNTLALVLPILALLCFAGAIALSRNRRRTLIWSALLVSAACVLIGLSLTMGRAAYLQAIVSPTISEESASVVFDTVVRFLRNGIRVFFFLGLIVAASAAITGGGAWAIKLRRTVGGVVTQGARSRDSTPGLLARSSPPTAPVTGLAPWLSSGWPCSCSIGPRLRPCCGWSSGCSSSWQCLSSSPPRHLAMTLSRTNPRSSSTPNGSRSSTAHRQAALPFALRSAVAGAPSESGSMAGPEVVGDMLSAPALVGRA